MRIYIYIYTQPENELIQTNWNTCTPSQAFIMPCEDILPYYYPILSWYSTHWGYSKELHLHKLLVVNMQQLFFFNSKTVWFDNCSMIVGQRL